MVAVFLHCTWSIFWALFLSCSSDFCFDENSEVGSEIGRNFTIIDVLLYLLPFSQVMMSNSESAFFRCWAYLGLLDEAAKLIVLFHI